MNEQNFNRNFGDAEIAGKRGTLHFDVSQRQKSAWVRASQRAGMKLAAWAIDSLNAAAQPRESGRWNTRLRRISAALRLTHADIARACQLGGMTAATRSRATMWLANPNSTKIGAHGQTLSKYRPMREHEFDAFLGGLEHLLSEIDND